MTDPHLSPEVRKRIERRLLVSSFLKYTAIFVAGAWMAATTVQLQDTTQAIRDTQTEGSPLLLAIQDQADDIQRAVEAAIATNEQIADCLDPAGKCYKDSQQRSAKFAALLIVGQACAAGFQNLSDSRRIEATNECVAAWTRDHPELLGPQQQ